MHNFISQRDFSAGGLATASNLKVELMNRLIYVQLSDTTLEVIIHYQNLQVNQLNTNVREKLLETAMSLSKMQSQQYLIALTILRNKF